MPILVLPPLLVRAARRRAKWSQRELAEHAGVARSVVARIESGAARDPGILLLVRILRVMGLDLLVVDRRGRPFNPEPHADDEPRDRAGRRFPAHLPLRQIDRSGVMDDWWWGWNRIAWPLSGPLEKIPYFTFDRRRQRPWFLDDWFAEHRWDDAT